MAHQNCRVGCEPVCGKCGRPKVPTKRAIQPLYSYRWCTPASCLYHRVDPTPCDLWPGEDREPPPLDVR